MNKIFGIVLLAVGMALAGSAQAIVCQATTETEWTAVRESTPEQCPIIRSLQDWDDYIDAHYTDQNYAVHKLTATQLTTLTNSLVFSGGSFVSMEYSILDENLTSTERGQLLGDLGISDGLARDHRFYKCAAPHDCSLAVRHICLTGC